jgi:hypothetical protein
MGRAQGDSLVILLGLIELSKLAEQRRGVLTTEAVD